MTTQPPQSSSDLRNLVIALVLASIIMVGWQHFYEQPRIEAQKLLQAQTAETLKSARDSRVKDQLPTAEANLSTAHHAPAPTTASAQPSARITIDSPTLSGSIALRGAVFDDIILKQYEETLKKDSDAVHLLSAGDGKHAPYSANFGIISSDAALKLPNRHTLWQTKSTRLTPESPLVLTYHNGQGLTFTKTISVDAHYMFTITLDVANKSGKTVALYPYGLINRTLTKEENQQFALLHEGPIGVTNGTLQHIAYSDLREDGPASFDESNGWLGITDKYWLTAMIPAQSDAVDMRFRHLSKTGGNSYQVDMRGHGVQLASGEQQQFTTRFYAGAKEVKLLDHYRELLGIPLFDRAVDFGALYFLTKPIFSILSFFYKFAGNFGVAILLLTICIRLLMFPLANKSFIAMSRMKLLAPKMKEIREKYQGDAMKMNLEIMNLYKREKVNPVSGCLPILLQLPVFFALYKVLFVTIEMRHAPFFGWVDDLSAPDPTSIINLFGLLPFATSGLPGWLNIGIWPLVMCATMVLQQRINPKPADEMQATLMAWMPFVFLFMFANFPAGLVIYWAWNNILSITQQWIIQRRLQAKNGTK